MTKHCVAITVTSYGCLSLDKFLSVLLSTLSIPSVSSLLRSVYIFCSLFAVCILSTPSASSMICLQSLCLCLDYLLCLRLMWLALSASFMTCLRYMPGLSALFASFLFYNLSAIYASFAPFASFILYGSFAVYSSSAPSASSVARSIYVFYDLYAPSAFILYGSSTICALSALSTSFVTHFVCIFYSLSTVYASSPLSTSVFFVSSAICASSALSASFVACLLFLPYPFYLNLLSFITCLLLISRPLYQHLPWLALSTSFVTCLIYFYIINFNQRHLHQIRS